MREDKKLWKFTTNNYSIVWQGPVTTSMYYPQDDDPEDQQFAFTGICVDRRVMAACWYDDEAMHMGIVPSMIPIHFTICRQAPAISATRDLTMNESFQIPMDNILVNHILEFDNIITRPYQIKLIKIKIGIPNDDLPTIDAIYCDQDGDTYEIQKTLLGKMWEAEHKRIRSALIGLASDIDSIRAIQRIIPKMDGYWKDYVEEMYPDEYDSFEKALLNSLSTIRNSASRAANIAVEKKATPRELIMPEWNIEILEMVVEGMAIYEKSIKGLSDDQCEAIWESMSSITPEDVAAVDRIRQENAKKTRDEKVFDKAEIEFENTFGTKSDNIIE